MDTSFSKPLLDALHRAIQCMKHAMENGQWDPSPDRDPIPFIESIEATLSMPSSSLKPGSAQDLAAIALGAMQKGEWSAVSETDISDIQRLNFMATLADEAMPSPRLVAQPA
jgi:hypothetical protein